MPGSYAPTSVTGPGYTAEHACGSVGQTLSQSGCLTHDQMLMLGTELGLMEMTDAEYAHLQHLIQAHMEAQAGPPDGPDAGAHPAATQAIDLSTSTEEHCVLVPDCGEKTPASYGDVPGYVLAKVRGEDSPMNSSCSSTSEARSRSAARVCLEKRFNSMSAEMPRTINLQSAVLNNFLTVLQQNNDSQEEVTHTQMQKWRKSDGVNPFEVSSPYTSGHIPYIIEPNIRQGFIIPKSFSLHFHPERTVTKAACMDSSSPAAEQQMMNLQSDDTTTPAAPKTHGRAHSSTHVAPGSSSRRRAQSCVSLNQRKERHNSKERERRRRIRLYCDELNMLVPFCNSDTDKVTTLQWTTAYLTYINKSYGDTLKEEFQKSVTDEKGVSVQAGSCSGQDKQKMDKCLNSPLEVEP